MANEWSAEELYLIAQRGYEVAMQGRYEVAVSIFEGLLAASPSHLYARRALAAVQLRMGQAGAALGTLRNLPLTDPAARRLRLEAHLALGARTEAVAEFSAALTSLDPPAARRYALLLESAGTKQLSGPRTDNPGARTNSGASKNPKEKTSWQQ